MGFQAICLMSMRNAIVVTKPISNHSQLECNATGITLRDPTKDEAAVGQDGLKMSPLSQESAFAQVEYPSHT